MTFENEYISEEDIKSFDIDQSHKPPGFRFQWTIDRTRNFYFMVIGGGGREEVNVLVGILNRLGKRTEFRLARTSEGSKSLSDSPFYIVWELSNAAKYDSETLKVLKEALVAYGYSCMRRQIPNTVVKFKF